MKGTNRCLSTDVIRRTGKNEFFFDGFEDLEDAAYLLVADEHISLSKRPSRLAMKVEIGKDGHAVSDELAELFDSRKIANEYEFMYVCGFYAEREFHPDLCLAQAGSDLEASRY